MHKRIIEFALYTYLALLLCVFYGDIFAVPSQVLIIRHGEKTTDPKNINLNTRGFQRSFALVPFFANMPVTVGGNLPKNALQIDGSYILPALYGQPSALYAKGQKDNTDSIRPIMTITPLAKQLNLDINHQITEDSYDKKNPLKYQNNYLPLIQDIMTNQQNDGKIVLICWEHNAIPTMTQAFLTKYANGAQLPKHLKNPKVFEKFDRIFRLTFKNGNITNFDNLAQELLFGDSDSSTNELYTVRSKQLVRNK